MVYSEHLLSRAWNLGKFQAESLSDVSPIKTPGTEPLVSFLKIPFHSVVRTHCWGVEHILRASTERRLLEGYIWLPQTFPHAPFPNADFSFYPIAVINPSHEKDYTLHPMRSTNKLLPWWGSWDPWDKSITKFLQKFICHAQYHFLPPKRGKKERIKEK